jgi:hypothetical protein
MRRCSRSCRRNTCGGIGPGCTPPYPAQSAGRSARERSGWTEVADGVVVAPEQLSHLLHAGRLPEGRGPRPERRGSGQVREDLAPRRVEPARAGRREVRAFEVSQQGQDRRAPGSGRPSDGGADAHDPVAQSSVERLFAVRDQGVVRQPNACGSGSACA